MLKLLTYILIFYLAYRFIVKPALLPPSEEDASGPKVKIEKKPDANEGEYIDYEEVE